MAITEAVIKNVISSTGLTNTLLFVMLGLMLELEGNLKRLFDLHEKDYVELIPVSFRSILGAKK